VKERGRSGTRTPVGSARCAALSQEAQRTIADAWVACASALIRLAQSHPRLGTSLPPFRETLRLREALDEYVRALRVLGTSRETALVAVQRIVAETGAHSRTDVRLLMRFVTAHALQTYPAIGHVRRPAVQ
jgi:hypothetical protein